jgi:hypothetical protein
MFSGVSKSGSPWESAMQSRPDALRARALALIAIVAEGFTRFSAWDVDMGFRLLDSRPVR